MNKDVVVDRYGRLYEIPYGLALLGHEVAGFCLSYQGHEDGQWNHDIPGGKGLLQWKSCNTGRYHTKFFFYPHYLLKELKSFKPDIIVGASDIPHIVLAHWLSRQLSVPYAVDLYDNFESFAQAKIPGFVAGLRYATSQAAIVTATSAPLRDYVIETYFPMGKVIALPSTVDKTIFRPAEKMAAREALGLPCDAKLIGTAGALSKLKGIDELYNAWRILEEQQPELHLVLAGPLSKDIAVPEGSRVHQLGMLSHEKIAQLFCALDVGVICIPDTPFGRYCFPQKAYEMLACNLPVVVSNVGALGDLLKDFPSCLYRSGSVDDMVDKLLAQLEAPQLLQLHVSDWQELSLHFEKIIRSVVI